MKKSIIAFASLGMFALASCSSDDIITDNGNDGNVTFAVTLPDGMDSRAFAEAEAAKTLTYAVYETNSTTPVFTGKANGGRSFTVNLNLVRGKHYDFVFWADKGDGSIYQFNASTQSVKVVYDGAAVNDDTRDAFFNVVKDFEVTGAMQKSVELRRPFAQINVGTSDIAVAEAAKTIVETTQISVEGVHDNLNLMTGVASGAVDVTFTAAARPDGETFPYESATYDYLGMVYVLTGTELESTDVQHAQSELYNVDIDINYTDGKTTHIDVDNAPVQRNYRTNIFGALLTSPFDVDVIIMPGFFDPNHNKPASEPWDGKTVKSPAYDEATATYTVAEPSEFVGLLQAANAGTTDNLFEGQTIKLTSDLNFGGNAIPMIAEGATRKSGSSNGKAFTGILDGNNCVISNFTIENNSSDGNAATGFIASLKGKDAAVKNIIFENVKISSASAEQTAIIALVSEGATVEGIEVKSGSFTGTESTAGIVGRILSSGTIKNCKNGATVHGSKHNIGGIVGSAYYQNNGMSIENCDNTGNVTSDYMCAGGIVGFNCGEIKGCTNSGMITGNSSTGGIVGEQQNSGIISDCHNSGEILNTSSYGAGGIVGWVRYIGSESAYPNKSKIVIEDCSNSASVTGATGVAGIAGMIYAYGTVRRCVNTAPSITSFEEGWQEKYDSHKGTFASGIANQQSDARNHIDALGDYEIIITDNVSTTPIENIIGNCNDVIIYVNDPQAVTASNNSTSLPD